MFRLQHECIQHECIGFGRLQHAQACLAACLARCKLLQGPDALEHTPRCRLPSSPCHLRTRGRVLTHVHMRVHMRVHAGAVSSGDWGKYEKLCDKNMTCFEPETVGYVAKGLNFHKFYFDLPSSPPAVKPNVTLADVHVRMLTGGSLRPSVCLSVAVSVAVSWRCLCRPPSELLGKSVLSRALDVRERGCLPCQNQCEGAVKCEGAAVCLRRQRPEGARQSRGAGKI